MKYILLLSVTSALSIPLMCSTAQAKITAGSYDMPAARDASTLETRVIEDWHPWAKDASVRQKLVEITVCEWWPGQKVRLPVTFIAPSSGAPCRNLVVDNAGLELKAASPAGAKLRLVKASGV